MGYKYFHCFTAYEKITEAINWASHSLGDSGIDFFCS